MSKKTTRTSARALVLPVMPDRTITVLTLATGILFAFYLVMVIVTIMFATMQTSLAQQVRSTEGAISDLETTYYAAIESQNAASPASIGLVAPTEVEYAVQKPAQGLSFAGH